ncbi:MAG: hypothetical protein RL291_305 [Pseudomonadota bacterium]
MSMRSRSTNSAPTGLLQPQHVNPVQWEQNVGYARTVCARIFRDGGTPADALKAFGLDAMDAGQDWSATVDRIAAALATPAQRRRAA